MPCWLSTPLCYYSRFLACCFCQEEERRRGHHKTSLRVDELNSLRKNSRVQVRQQHTKQRQRQRQRQQPQQSAQEHLRRVQ
jgi:hypothetical protein